MAWNHPPSILVIAILHLVGGIGGLMIDLCGAGLTAASEGNPGMFGGPPQQQDMQKRMEAHVAREVPYQKATNYASMAVSLILDVMLITAGVGLLYLKSWARVLSLVYAVLSILAKIHAAVFTLAFLMPAMTSFYEQEGKNDPAMAAAASIMPGAMFMGVLFVLALMIYPIVVLILLTRPSVKAAFAGGGAPGPREDERWDEGFGYPDDPDDYDDRDDRGGPSEGFTARP